MKNRDYMDQEENRTRDLKSGDRVWYQGWSYDEPVEYEVIAVDKRGDVALRCIEDGDLRVEAKGELYVSALVCGRRHRDGAYKDACREAKRAEELYLSRSDRIESAYKALDEAATVLLSKDGVKVRKRYRVDIPSHAKTRDAVEKERERVLNIVRDILSTTGLGMEYGDRQGIFDRVIEAAKGQAK